MSLRSRGVLPLFLAVLALALSRPLCAGDKPATFPLSDIKPGLKGVVYTIFSGDQIEKVDLEVIGVLQNALGPKQDVILVRLLGDKVEQTGVVAGMSGSPVYIDGKLVGALSLKLGIFTKEAIGGVTPIENMLDVEKSSASPLAPVPGSDATQHPSGSHVSLPADLARRISTGEDPFLVQIETPLISAGIYPETLARFSKDFSAWGMTTLAGGTSAPTPEDAQLKPGDMVGVDLIRGDLSVSAGCTVTTVEQGGILACGHPLFDLGPVAMPLSRAHVLMTLASSMVSTKLMTTGGIIGTLTQDRTTAIMGKLGAGPPMIPLDITLETPAVSKRFHFDAIESPQLTPLLVALATYNGIVGSPAYGEGSTLQLDGTVALEGHTPVRLEDLFTPTDSLLPSGLHVALDIQNAFARVYSNPYEIPKVERIDLHVSMLPERRSATIDSAWLEKSEVSPGETVAVKVLLRPYRGAPFVQEIPVTVPPQAAHGPLQLVISDAETLNRNLQLLDASSQARLPGLEELIKLINRERHNDRLYATLLQPTPTLLVEDKEMPNAPTSEINVLDQRQNPAARVWYGSLPPGSGPSRCIK